MDLYRAFKLIIKYFWLLVTVPIIAGGLMFFATRTESREFTSKATIYTGLTSGYSIESQAGSKVDYFATSAAFDNMLNILKSKNVLEETGLRLFIQAMMLDEPNPRIISQASYAKLQKITPDEVKALIVKNNPEETYRRLMEYKKQSSDNFIYELLNLTHKHYSVEALSKVSAKRVQGSDLLEISFKSDDPGITYQTLIMIIDVFFKVHSGLKLAQTSTVVDYFEKQLENSWQRLVNEENKLLEFNKTNKIINYHEQTKYVASQKEQFELSVQKAQMEQGAALSVLDRLENEITNRHDVNLKTQRIGNLRNELLQINRLIEKSEIFNPGDISPEKKEELVKRKLDLENKIRFTVDSLFRLERNVDGVEREYILTQWFENVIQLESANARIEVLNNKRVEFDSLYMFFAPLGATINRIERAIDVLEREYLSILHNLGLAKLKQQNLELSSTMDILDKPFFPIVVQPSKRKLFVLIIAVFSAFFVLAGIFIIEFLDRRLKTVKKLEKTTGIPVAGAVLSGSKKSRVDIGRLSRRAITDLIGHTLYNIETQNAKPPYLIKIFSHWLNEGKTFVISKLKDEIKRLDFSVIVIQIRDEYTEETNIENAVLIEETEYHAISQPDDWRNFISGLSMSTIDFIIIEVPALSSFRLNSFLSKTSNLNYLLANASRTWSSADEHYIGKLRSVSDGHLFAILNNITVDNIEEFIGDIPKKRSPLRKLIKNRIVKRYLGFHS